MNNKTGFTLAEVLITLGIIGVVAAMTIPSSELPTTGIFWANSQYNSFSADCVDFVGDVCRRSPRKDTQLEALCLGD